MQYIYYLKKIRMIHSGERITTHLIGWKAICRKIVILVNDQHYLKVIANNNDLELDDENCIATHFSS